VNKKVLFIDSVHPVLQQRLAEAGYLCDHSYTLPRNELMMVAGEYYGIVIRSRITLDQSFIDACTALRFIARSGSGLENIDVAYAESKGIRIFNSPEGNRDAVGEHAIGMLLMLLNNLKRADGEVRNRMWKREENRGTELSEKTVGIIGYGVMGSGLAKKLSGFGCKVIAHDKYRSNFSDQYATEVSLAELQSAADIVSLHLPLTPETLHYADDPFFNAFSKPVYFINTARGKNVKTSALIAALLNGQVKGACLDVLEYEKASLEGLDEHSDFVESFEALRKMENVVLSPHIAGWTHESYFKLSDVLADKILGADMA
jgi:D-3-phosphoglycerate dehydrogenase / 2-oxoglutarate reductase